MGIIATTGSPKQREDGSSQPDAREGQAGRLGGGEARSSVETG